MTAPQAKIRLQARAASASNAYRGTFHCLAEMVRAEGFLSLYRGLLSPVMGYGVINAVAFGSNEQMKNFLAGDQEATLKHMIPAGMFAGFTSGVVRSPIELVKTVMQARNAPGALQAPYKSSLHCAVDVVRTEGIGSNGLFRGLFATQAREIMQYAVYFPAYELSKRSLATRFADGDPSQLNPLLMALAGGFAGVACVLPARAAQRTGWVPKRGCGARGVRRASTLGFGRTAMRALTVAACLAPACGVGSRSGSQRTGATS